MSSVGWIVLTLLITDVLAAFAMGYMFVSLSRQVIDLEDQVDYWKNQDAMNKEALAGCRRLYDEIKSRHEEYRKSVEEYTRTNR